MPAEQDPDLSFAFRAAKGGDVAIFRQGRRVTMLRGGQALAFLGEVQGASAAVQQQVMARYTGNYKRGNERLATAHPRNR